MKSVVATNATSAITVTASGVSFALHYVADLKTTETVVIKGQELGTKNLADKFSQGLAVHFTGCLHTAMYYSTSTRGSTDMARAAAHECYRQTL